MSFDPQRFRDLAGVLLSSCPGIADDESRNRAVVHCCHYSMILFARGQMGLSQDTRGLHRKVVSHYSSLQLPEIGKRLKRSLDIRIKADYRTDGYVSRDDAEKSYEDAKRVIFLMKQMRAGKKRATGSAHRPKSRRRRSR